MKIVNCDVCQNVIEDSRQYTEMMLRDDTGQWVEVDLCSTVCVLEILALDDPSMAAHDEEPEEEEEGELEIEEATFQLTPEPVKELSNEDRIENEKRYKKQAAEVTSQLTLVRDLSLIHI